MGASTVYAAIKKLHGAGSLPLKKDAWTDAMTSLSRLIVQMMTGVDPEEIN